MSRVVDAQNLFVRTAMKAPYLEREEEHQLAVEWRDSKDQQAFNQLITAHMRLVISVASRYKNYGLSVSDLIQEGHVGLLEAAARFDPDREVRFSTYATWWIRASIQDFVLRNWSIVRGGTSSAQKALFFNLRRLRAKLAQQDDKISEPQIYQQISTKLGISQKDVEVMDGRLSGGDMSMNAPVSDQDGQGSLERQDFFVSPDPLPEQIVTEEIDSERIRIQLGHAMQCLNERERQILKERRLAEDGKTLETLGKSLGVSKERVRQIEARALEKLKVALIKEDPRIGDSIN